MQPLVAQFVAAKRSLSTATQVQRAQEIVQAARLALEETAALTARNSFVRRTLTSQTVALLAIHRGMEQVGAAVEGEFSVRPLVLV